MKGGITTEHTMWCAICEFWDQQSYRLKRSFIKHMRAKGWKKKQGRWVCPDCAAMGAVLSKED